ncbi:hypothetical protein BKA62DRAFT_668459 [Auriculariales sp. MPI-PUGE-AT-0066]|nr:hypothetical protein BKA62DRAFT_668459 [Auriculariales sp. MPI-PUGE-AT-0066]
MAQRTARKTRAERESSGPTLTLSRGEACLPCRRKKSRCDGDKPSCKQCAKIGRPDGCEYQDSRFLNAISMLEERVRTLQGRINDLEVPVPAGATTTTSAASKSPVWSAALTPGPSSHNSQSKTSHIPSTSATTAAQPTSSAAPPTAISEMAARCLLQAFYQHAPLFGMPDQTVARLPDVHPALIEAVYAASCHFAGPEQATLHLLEGKFISRAELALAESDATSYPPAQTRYRPCDIEKVQAQAILASLLFMDPHQSMVRALGHAGGAMRVARYLGLCNMGPSVDPETIGTWLMVCGLDIHMASAELLPSSTTTVLQSAGAFPHLPLTMPFGLGSPAASTLGMSSFDTQSISSLSDDASFF